MIIANSKGIGKDKEIEIIKNIESILINEMAIGVIEKLAIIKLEVIGSRKNGRYRKDSDLDILIEYKDDVKEYIVFNMLNGLELEYDGINIDFIPVCKFQ